MQVCLLLLVMSVALTALPVTLQAQPVRVRSTCDPIGDPPPGDLFCKPRGWPSGRALR